MYCFFFSSRRRHTRCGRDWSSDVCSSDLLPRTKGSRRKRSPTGQSFYHTGLLYRPVLSLLARNSRATGQSPVLHPCSSRFLLENRSWPASPSDYECSVRSSLKKSVVSLYLCKYDNNVTKLQIF